MTAKNFNTSYPLKKCLLIFYLSMIVSTHAQRPIQRLQRQAITNELGLGLTNTGTSFNSWNNDYNSFDSNYDYQPQQNSWNSYDDYQGGRTYGKYPYRRNQYSPSYGGTYGSSINNWQGFGLGRGTYGSRPTQSHFGVKS